MRVYLLSDYGEHGSCHVVATVDITKLPGLLTEKFPYWAEEAMPQLRELLLEDAPIDGRDLLIGWGGVQLHVIELA